MQRQSDIEDAPPAREHAGYPLVRDLLLATGLAVLLIIAGLFGAAELADVVLSQYQEPPIWQQPAAFYDAAEEQLNLTPPAETVQVYFTAGDGRLYPQAIYSEVRLNDYQKARLILAGLLKGPRAGYLLSALPPGVQLRGVFLIAGARGAAAESGASTDAEGERAGVIVVNLSERMAQNLPGGASGEWLALMAIVNSLLANLKDYQAVQFLIEGQVVEGLGGGIDLSAPLKQNFLLIAEQPAPGRERL